MVFNKDYENRSALMTSFVKEERPHRHGQRRLFEEVPKESSLFLAAILFVTSLITLFPGIALFLPNMMRR